MAKINSEILKIINDYLILLNQNGFKVISAYLYGSYVNKSHDEWSDIDLALVSENFEGNRFLDKEKIRGLYRKIDSRLSVLPLNPESLNSFFVQSEVINKGIKII